MVLKPHVALLPRELILPLAQVPPEEDERADGDGAGGSSRERESLTLHIVGGSQSDVRSLVGEARLKYLEKERMRLKKMMEADFHGKYKVELERGLASMMNKMEENAEETPQAEAPEEEEDDTADGAKQEKMKKLKDTIAREKGVLDE